MHASGAASAIARGLADAFASGPWTADAIVEAGVRVLGRRYRWLAPFADRLMAEFPSQLRPRSARIADFLLNDHGFRLACEKNKMRLRFNRWPEPAMNPADGPPATWKVPPLTTVADLTLFLGLDSHRLDWFADLGGLLVRAPSGPLWHYHYEWRSKRSGEPRLIESPKPELKKIQRKLLAEVLDRIPAHEAAHGFRAGRSILTFAEPHVARAVVLKLDLRDFFASILAARVESIFLTAGYPEEAARYLAGLCTNRAPFEVLRKVRMPGAGESIASRHLRELYGRRHLPQGAPTSPALANLCAFRMDARLSGLARAAGANYTRYADDLVFSGDPSFARGVAKFAPHVAGIVLAEGFSVNHHKTRVMRAGARQQVAGVVVNQRPNISRASFDELKAILHNCVRHGPESQNRQGVEDFRAHLAGRIAHVAMLHPERGLRLREEFHRVIW